LRKDLAAAVLLLVALLLPGLRALRSPAQPAEDAAMLMRYVEHLAGGAGLVWNPGEPPVDGATDFLFTVLSAGLVRLGLPLETVVRGLGFAAHLLTVLLVYAAIRRLHGSPVPLALVSALFLAWGPGFRYVEMYFGTPLFALLATVAWILACRLRERPTSLPLALGFALASLATGLARPEGVFLTLFMLAAVAVWTGPRRAWRPVAVFAAVFALLGGAYFLWRWRYFGHPLPTPFYKKGGGALHWGGLTAAVLGVAQLCLPFLLAAPLALRSADARRRLVFSLFPIGGFTLIWVLLSNEMNILQRFQFALVPIVLISWPDWVRGLRDDLRLPAWAGLPPAGRRAAALFLAAVAGVALALQLFVYRSRPDALDGRYQVANLLARYGLRGYTLVTTEAGLLPLYSRWRSTDAWGLNDFEIARRGLSPKRLDRERPAVIVYHANLSPMVPGPLGGDDWSRLIASLQGYAEGHGYILAAVYGHNPYDTHTYFVRPDIADAPAIVAGIRGVDYRWFDGQPCINYALWTASGPTREVP
jgi:arabinofuranosyltransferase